MPHFEDGEVGLLEQQNIVVLCRKCLCFNSHHFLNTVIHTLPMLCFRNSTINLSLLSICSSLLMLSFAAILKDSRMNANSV